MAAASVRMAEIVAMLNACADGHEIQTTDHHHWILFNGKTFRRIPLGKHGHRRNVEVEIGHVRSMVRHLGIDSGCAKKHITTL